MSKSSAVRPPTDITSKKSEAGRSMRRATEEIELMINLKTAKTLGGAIQRRALARGQDH